MRPVCRFPARHLFRVARSSSTRPRSSKSSTPTELNMGMPQPKRVKVGTASPPPTIALLPAERLLRSLILECRDHHRDTDPAFAALRIWITGGWVRDRLLGIPSHDVDLSLSSMTGGVLADALTQFYRSREAEWRARALEAGVADPVCTNFKTTRQNPGKSKSLETAVGRIFGLDVDLVNLRNETYDDPGSRVPTMVFGTPREDAERRDATVNALFFDLDNQVVCDYTERGLADLAAHVMRTPVQPRQTFLDDPLRVLRLVRMAAKLGYRLDPDAKASMSQPEIHDALAAKVSRDRVGIETVKMMRGRDPHVAMRLLWECGLWEVVFVGLGSRSGPALRESLVETEGEMWPGTWPRAYGCLADLLAGPDDAHAEGSALTEMIKTDEEKRDLFWLMAGLCPLAPLRSTTSRLRQAVDEVTAALKLTHIQTVLFRSALQHVGVIREAVALVSGSGAVAPPPPRSAIATRIRECGKTWRQQVVFSLLAELVCAEKGGGGREGGEKTEERPEDDRVGEKMRKEMVWRYARLAEFIARERLGDAHSARPLLDGNELMALFEVTKKGPWVKTVMDELVEWQFDQEAAAEGGKDDDGLEEARAWLLRARGRLGVPKE